MLRNSVLLIGLDSDLHLDAAYLELRRREIDVVRFNPERVSRENSQITLHVEPRGATADVTTYAGTFRTDKVLGVWCRYALEAMSSDCDDNFLQFSNAEFLVTLKGALLQIPAERWINDPFAESRADNKPHQLALANSCGLKVPPTIVSQSKSELIAFADTYGACVIKPLGDVSLVVEYGHEMKGSFAALLDRSAIEFSAWDESCPVMLQKYIEKHADVRVTVIDGLCFAAKLTQPCTLDDKSVDFRNATELVTQSYDLPPDAQRSLVQMVGRLGLRYASCDFCLDDSDLYFLEANVAGNYLWTELEAGLLVTSAIVDSLTK